MSSPTVIDDRPLLSDEPRWVGVTPPDSDYLDKVKFLADHHATRLADAVVDGEREQWWLDYLRENYLDAREQLRVAENAYDRMWVESGRQGRFAGWLIRDQRRA